MGKGQEGNKGATMVGGKGEGLRAYYQGKIEEMEIVLGTKTQNLRRLEAQRNELNSKGVFMINTISEPTSPYWVSVRRAAN
jgi:hypothetical protein